MAPAPDGRGMPDEHKPQPPHRLRGFWIFVAVLLAINVLSVVMTRSSGEPRVKVPFSPYFLRQVDAGKVKSISSKSDTIEGTFKQKVGYRPASKTATPTTLFSTEVPTFWDDAALTKLLQSNGVQVNAQNPNPGTSLLAEILLGFGPTLLLVALFVFLGRRGRRAGGGLGGLGNFGRSQARRVDPTEDPGHLRRRRRNRRGEGGARRDRRLPQDARPVCAPRRAASRTASSSTARPAPARRCVARAVAGEAQAAFFSIAASEFIEAIVGVGASRVRDLFAKAKEAAPSIIFIDELDAVGRSRQGLGRHHRRQRRARADARPDPDRDGRVRVRRRRSSCIGATNRPEILDPALLRPGRFDRRVAVQPPDKDGRRKILEVHTRGLPLADDVDLEALAATTPGMVGADLANLANEAALLAARRNHDKVEMADFTDSLEKILLGAPRGIVLGPEDRERTAYHESGHALVGMLTPEADPVRKVSIIPRGQALGVTLSTPDSDRVSYSREELEARIKVSLGGRVAEEVVYGKITTGAESDLQQLTEIARQMVGRWGMSEKVGPIVILPARRPATAFPGTSELSPETQALIDEEVHRIVEEAHVEVTDLLTEHRDQLDGLAHALLEAETLDAPAAYAAAGVPLRTAELEATVASDPA